MRNEAFVACPQTLSTAFEMEGYYRRAATEKHRLTKAHMEARLHGLYSTDIGRQTRGIV